MEPNQTATDGRGRLYGALGTGAVLAGGLAYIGLGDPHGHRFMFPGCPFKMVTGFNCPGCGGLRMTHDLLHLDFGAAVVDNLFLLVGLPMLAAWLLVRWKQGQEAHARDRDGGGDRRGGRVDGGSQSAGVPAGTDASRWLTTALRRYPGPEPVKPGALPPATV